MESCGAAVFSLCRSPMILIRKRSQKLQRPFCQPTAVMLALILTSPVFGASQEATSAAGEASRFPCPENEIARYTA